MCQTPHYAAVVVLTLPVYEIKCGHAVIIQLQLRFNPASSSNHVLWLRNHFVIPYTALYTRSKGHEGIIPCSAQVIPMSLLVEIDYANEEKRKH